MRAIFYNPKENRFRAGWRILFTTGLAFCLLIVTAIFIQSEWGFNLVLAPVVLAAMFFASRNIDKRPFTEFGIYFKTDWIIDFLAGNLFAILSMGFIVSISILMGWITLTEIDFNILDTDFITGLLSALALMTAVSIWEEAYFRSYLITNLKEGFSFIQYNKRAPVVIAVIISSALFGTAHISNPNATWFSTFNIAIAGVVLAYPYIATKSLAIPVGMHLSWNYFQGVVFGLPVSGQALEPAILQFEISGPDLFTGGSFGPEAGLIGIIGLILMWILSYFYIVRYYKM